MDALVQSGMDSGLFYGAELLLARGPGLRFHRAYGTFDGSRKLEKGAIFDVASLTKPVATAALLLALGLPLGSPVCRYLPAFTGGGKEAVTLRHLAAHLSGLPATVRFIETCATPEETFNALLNVPLDSRPGEAVTYSCLGYMLLGKVLEAATGQPLDALFARHIAAPAGMKDSGFRPAPSPRLVPSGARPHNRGQPGLVHDSNAFAMGGVSGNAGLFATAADLHRFCQWALGQNFGPMWQNQAPPGAAPRSIGWVLHEGLACHTGFTGTALWLNPKTADCAVLLTNRTARAHRGTLDAMARFREQFLLQAVCRACSAAQVPRDC